MKRGGEKRAEKERGMIKEGQVGIFYAIADKAQNVGEKRRLLVKKETEMTRKGRSRKRRKMRQ